MAIEFCRIDDRLLHGQVVTTWLKRYDVEQAIIVSDDVAQDTMRQNVLKLAAPSGLRVVFFATDAFAEVYRKAPIKRRSMMIFTNPTEVLRLIQQGVDIKQLNVGNMSKTPDNEKITAGVALTEEDRAAFKAIIELGCSVEIQMVPTDKSVDMAEFVMEV